MRRLYHCSRRSLLRQVLRLQIRRIELILCILAVLCSLAASLLLLLILLIIHLIQRRISCKTLLILSERLPLSEVYGMELPSRIWLLLKTLKINGLSLEVRGLSRSISESLAGALLKTLRVLLRTGILLVALASHSPNTRTC